MARDESSRVTRRLFLAGAAGLGGVVLKPARSAGDAAAAKVQRTSQRSKSMVPTIDDLATATATELAKAVAERQVSALELADAAIARIEALDGPINAIVVRDFDRAREQAREVDKAVARGERLPLMGVPMTVKEVYNIAGLPTTFGLPFAKNHRPTEDATAVSRLKAAGAVILGKSNIALGLSDWQSENPIYGRTKNPHDLECTPGGSSGGSAAALAAGMVPLELGGDVGGSIRIPSAFCGTFGHMSSFGIVSLEGHGPPGGGFAVGRNWGAAGPMARSAADLDLALSLLVAPDGRDTKAYRLALPPPRHTRLSDYRVLVVTQHPDAPVDDEIVKAIDSLASSLESAGARVVRDSPLFPAIADSQLLAQSFTEVLKARMPMPGAPPSTKTIKDYFDCLTAQEGLRRKWDAFFKSFDVVITPCFGSAAFRYFDEPDQDKRTLLINGKGAAYKAQYLWPMLSGIPHLPATAAPIGRTAGGLPIGAQFIGPFLEDRTPIAFAGLLSAEFRLKAQLAHASTAAR